MSQLQNDDTNVRDNMNQTTIHGVGIDDTKADANRRALYESFRQRDAWLRKAWGPSPAVVEFQ